VVDLESELSTFADRIEATDNDATTRPRTSFDLLETRPVEQAWQSYIAYFLDPGAGHGLEERFLYAFLSHLEERNAISFSPVRSRLTPPNEVDVQTGLHSATETKPDIFVSCGDNWYLWLHLAIEPPVINPSLRSYARCHHRGRSFAQYRDELKDIKQTIAEVATKKKKLEIQRRRHKKRIEDLDQKAKRASEQDNADRARRVRDEKEDELAEIRDLEDGIAELEQRVDRWIEEKNKIQAEILRVREEKEVAKVGVNLESIFKRQYSTDKKTPPPPESVATLSTDDIIPDDGPSGYSASAHIRLKQSAMPSSDSETWADVDWADLVAVVEETIQHVAGDVPVQTTGQLSELATAIKTDAPMTDRDETKTKHKDLYFEYRDAIEKSDDAVETFVEEILMWEWAAVITDEDRFRPSNADQYEWTPALVGEPWGKIRSSRWDDARDEPEAVDIHWEHQPTRDAFETGTVTFLLVVAEPGKSTIDADSDDRYHQFASEILDRLAEMPLDSTDARWEEYEIDPVRANRAVFRATYDYQPGDEDGYYQCLQHALEDTGPITKLTQDVLESNEYTSETSE
jgi:hypothetical protein